MSRTPLGSAATQTGSSRWLRRDVDSDGEPAKRKAGAGASGPAEIFFPISGRAGRADWASDTRYYLTVTIQVCGSDGSALRWRRPFTARPRGDILAPVDGRFWTPGRSPPALCRAYLAEALVGYLLFSSLLFPSLWALLLFQR